MNRKLGTLIVATAAFASSQVASGTVLAGFNDFNNTAPNTNFFSAGLTGSSTASLTYLTGGSTDGTYGNLPSPLADVRNGSVATFGQGGNTASLTINNVSAGPLVLNALHFDLATFADDQTYTITAVKGASNFAIATNAAVIKIPSNSSAEGFDYEDYFVPFAPISLTTGESITFTFSSITDNVINIDNFAVVPEPGSLMALGCLMGGGAFFRSRRRRA